MKKLIFNTFVLAAAVCLLSACSSEDDDEMLERQSRGGFPVLRKSAEAQPILVCAGSTTTESMSVGGCNIKISASWSLYKAPPGSTVQPEGSVSISGHAEDGRFTCRTENLEYSWSGSSVSATATIKVIASASAPPLDENDENYNKDFPWLNDSMERGSVSVKLSATNGSGKITKQ